MFLQNKGEVIALFRPTEASPQQVNVWGCWRSTQAHARLLYRGEWVLFSYVGNCCRKMSFSL